MSTTWPEVAEFATRFPRVIQATDAGKPSLSVDGVTFVSFVEATHSIRLLLSAAELKVILESRDPAMYLVDGDDPDVIRVWLDEVDLDELVELLTESWRIAENHAQS